MNPDESTPAATPTADVGVYDTPLSLPKNSPPPRIRVIDYDADSITEEEITVAEDLRPFSLTERTTWIDIQGLGDEQTLRAIASIFGIHGIALADAVNVPQRAKTEDYVEHILVVIRAPQQPFDATSSVPQVCILLAGNYIVTFQERYFAFFGSVRDRLRDSTSMLRRGGPSMLSYALADVLVDQFYPIVEEISEQLDDIETRILEKPSPELVSQLHRLQRRITTLRRVARPQVEALYRLAHADSPLVPPESAVFLKDVEDHARQILGRLDACRDIATDTMGAVLATLGHRQNEVMKVLTLVGSIFIPLTFMAGIYVMNFEYMPELKVKAAYPILIGAMVIVAVGMVLLFLSRGWIGGGGGDDDDRRD